MGKSSISSSSGTGKSSWEKTAEDFNAGKVSQAWFYAGDDLDLILKGRRIESASLSDGSMATIVFDGGLMVQVYAGGYLADTSVRMGRLSSRSGEITATGAVQFERGGGLRRMQVFAWTTDEYGSEELEALFEVCDVEGGARGGRMFFGVAFCYPSASEHAVGVDR